MASYPENLKDGVEEAVSSERWRGRVMEVDQHRNRPLSVPQG